MKMTDKQKQKILKLADPSTVRHLCETNTEYKALYQLQKGGQPEQREQVVELMSSDNHIASLQIKDSAVLKDLVEFGKLSGRPPQVPITKRALDYLKMELSSLDADLDILLEIAKAANYLEMEDSLDSVTNVIAKKLIESL
jgi:hypothetical protein